jgi:hypothetical protein
MYDSKDLAYLAGVIDGEGHFYVPMCKNGRGVAYATPRILFVQSGKNNAAVLCEWVTKRFGGNTWHDKKRDMFRWTIQGSKAVALAKELKPYLIVKHRQVERLSKLP